LQASQTGALAHFGAAGARWAFFGAAFFSFGEEPALLGALAAGGLALALAAGAGAGALAFLRSASACSVDVSYTDGIFQQ
jgi:hypothetical protein